VYTGVGAVGIGSSATGDFSNGVRIHTLLVLFWVD
jgi:hypothetical protein